MMMMFSDKIRSMNLASLMCLNVRPIFKTNKIVIPYFHFFGYNLFIMLESNKRYKILIYITRLCITCC